MKAGRWISLAALALFAIAALPVAAQDVPLGDLARKNRKDTKSKKVITNEDIPESPAAGASAASASGSSGGSGTGAAESPSAAPSEPQAPNAAAGSAAQGAASSAPAEEDPLEAEIEQIQSELDALKQEAGVGVRSIEKLEEALKDPNLSEARRRTYQDILASGVDKVGSLESQITQKEQALQQAQDKKKAKDAARRPAAAPAPK